LDNEVGGKTGKRGIFSTRKELIPHCWPLQAPEHSPVELSNFRPQSKMIYTSRKAKQTDHEFPPVLVYQSVSLAASERYDPDDKDAGAQVASDLFTTFFADTLDRKWLAQERLSQCASFRANVRDWGQKSQGFRVFTTP
jgi:hypothetical protein